MNKLSKWCLSLAAMVLVGQPLASTVQAEEGLVEYPGVVEHEGEPIEGGVVRVALGGDPFAGILNRMLYVTGPDYTLINYFNPGLYGSDENAMIDESGFAKVDIDYENKQVKITVPECEKWDDGEPITIDDAILPYYVIGHPDYTGVRYGDHLEMIKGMSAYHNGETDTIEGVERVDDYTMILHYDELNPSVYLDSSIILNYMEPSHILKDIPVAELEDHPAVRQNPIGYGPFKVESIVPGESVTFVANEYYYKGKPKVDGLIAETVSGNNLVAELKAGHYDIASLPTTMFDEYKDGENYTLLGRITNIYSFIGFKMGTWDNENKEVDYNPELITANKALRQAMAYALDFEAVSTQFYNGLRKPANSHIPPYYSDVYNAEQEGYNYNPEKAKEILAEAGFEDIDGDGFVEDPEGNKLTLKYAGVAGGDIAEPLTQYYIQSWHDIGLDVQLLDGKLMEFNTYNERVESDDPEINIFEGTWGLLADANQSFIFARNAVFNDTRWATEEHDELLRRINSEETLDPEFRKQAYLDWQAYMIEEIPTIPTLYSYSITAVNKRVSEFGVAKDYDIPWEKIQLLAEEPIAE